MIEVRTIATVVDNFLKFESRVLAAVSGKVRLAPEVGCHISVNPARLVALHGSE